jgi:hypothetical protein
MFPLLRFLSTDGSFTFDDAKIQATGSYTPAAPGRFFIAPETDNDTYLISRLIILTTDGPGVVMGEDYGIIPALTDGILVSIADSSNVNILQMTGPIKSNADWAKYAFFSEPLQYGPGNNFIRTIWNFGASIGRPLELKGTNQRLLVTCQDDLTGLLSHNFFVHGQAPTRNPDFTP